MVMDNFVFLDPSFTFLSYTQRPLRKASVALLAVDEDELVHGPADRFNRMFFYIAFGIEQRDVRGELPFRQTLQTLSCQRGAERSPKRPQRRQPVIPKKDKRPITGLYSKAG